MGEDDKQQRKEHRQDAHCRRILAEREEQMLERQVLVAATLCLGEGELQSPLQVVRDGHAVPDDAAMLTVEFKTNLLAPARGERFIFRGKVVKPGRTITVCEAQAFGVDGGEERLVATMTGTLMALFESDDLKR